MIKAGDPKRMYNHQFRRDFLYEECGRVVKTKVS